MQIEAVHLIYLTWITSSSFRLFISLDSVASLVFISVCRAGVRLLAQGGKK